VPEVAVAEQVYSSDEMRLIEEIKRSYPVYVMSGRPAPRGFNVETALPRRGNSGRLRFGEALNAREDVVRYQKRVTAKTKIGAGGNRYLRATYAAHGQPLFEGIDRLLHSQGMIDYAHSVFPAEKTVPVTVYANVYLPGQGLLPHTDVPEFRGCERGQVAAWLQVAMHHSGLFERWRIPIITVVGYVDACNGGAFYFYPPDGTSKVVVNPSANSAVVLDADSVFHGVEEVEGDAGQWLDALDMYLVPSESESWRLYQRRAPEEVFASFREDQIRYSISWKAYCFPDASSHRTWSNHSDDVDLNQIVPRLEKLLAERGVLPVHDLSEDELARLMIDELIPFPAFG
jgi:hypothetical protein